MIVNRNTIREQNETIVLTAIINHPNTSRAAISHDSGLNKATVSEIVKKLLKEKLVVELGTGQSSVVGGRKPVLLKVNANGGYAMSLTHYTNKDFFARLQSSRQDRRSVRFGQKSGGQQYHRQHRGSSSLPQEEPRLRRPFRFVGIVVSIDGFVHEDEIVASTNKMLEHLTAKHLESDAIDCSDLSGESEQSGGLLPKLYSLILRGTSSVSTWMRASVPEFYCRTACSAAKTVWPVIWGTRSSIRSAKIVTAANKAA